MAPAAARRPSSDRRAIAARPAGAARGPERDPMPGGGTALRAAGRIGALLVLGIGLAGPVAAQAQAQDEGGTGRRIAVTGEGRVEAVPDMATVTLGVTEEADTASEALARNSAATAEVIAALDAAGVEARDRQTSGLNMSPRWENRSRNGDGPVEIVGYVVSNRVTVRVRDLERLGELLDAVVSGGANTLDALGFGIQEADALRDEARREAVADARTKAELYAEAAGVTLGQVLTIREGGGHGGPVAFDMPMAEMARSAVPVEAGEIEVTAQVEVVFEIAE